MTALVFFSTNYKGGFGFVNDEYEDVVLQTAQGSLTKKEIAHFFRKIRLL